MGLTGSPPGEIYSDNCLLAGFGALMLSANRNPSRASTMNGKQLREKATSVALLDKAQKAALVASGCKRTWSPDEKYILHTAGNACGL